MARAAHECLLRVCAVTRRRFPVGASPTRQPLQPEAIGAGMEETKCLKPSISGSRIGDRASVQAATRVNAEQASKRTMCRPTRQPFRGRLIWMGEFERRLSPICCTGVVAAACTQGKRTQHGKPQCVVRNDQPDAREGQAGRIGVAERLVVLGKSGNAGGGKGPQFKTNATSGEGRRLGNLATPKSVQKLQTALHAKAKAEAGYRFYALYDKISREDVLAHAYAQCRSNKGVRVRPQPGNLLARTCGERKSAVRI